MYKAWEASGWDSNLRPSVDRKDDFATYSLDNIQLSTWAENRERSQKEICSKRLTKLRKPLIINGVEYVSQREASRQLNIPQSTISRLVKGESVEGYEEFDVGYN
ncbi:hypothetical protein NVP1152O_057 [Vibrio phage 1.152.O._10N.222.46.E1]|uniref:Uncharacterized protein n=5 Tax=Nahantvirus 49C7 TaxID=2846601 RepID=A0A2I7RBD8_9CAUD|nr:coil containing protein [Vibrio phage 1.026.O._10N.222.49.C7]AUR82539.1 hypothetical protein NVP1025O_056 [Vibrio phage 1.025.O._10N.222.46.B6]AUR90789.1 hypothetical protein NVP1150O_056 [Vibrio phage 1.150.O._10N.222.46.A6]AUR90962.1 hypothetical protein NVP1152O_057 [Vibrio phage 1.152.O._10N.222.46.E1]AUS02430.1 hypothetical protein NVP2130O_056 [Vibrio phage 2.130.O._10N.222.46.C2]AUR82647.1 coil containing protein [Vibrio phage 1.026.O._10N.222.49.C7]